VAYRAIPPEERVTFVEHPVEAGETFTHIARLYGVSVADLRGANPRVEPRRMQIGQRIVVPKAPSARRASGSGGGTSEAERKRIVLYEVRAGDTLSAIAQRHRVSTEDLLRWNGLRRTSVIRPGDEVRIHLTGGTGR
jgi:membrane-bound lytic murein transglycosylase D